MIRTYMTSGLYGDRSLGNNPKTDYARVPKAIRKTRQNSPVRHLIADADGNLRFAAEFSGKRARVKRAD